MHDPRIDTRGWRPSRGRYLFWEPAHFVMERRMLLGIKERAERLARTHAPSIASRRASPATGS
jgi:hypothetical protein